MKTGAEKKKLIVLGVLMMLAIPVALYNFKDMLWPSHEATMMLATRGGSAQPQQTTEIALKADSSPGLDLDKLAASRSIAYQLGRNIFDVQQLPKKAKVPEGQDPGHEIGPQPPTIVIPPMPVKFYGFTKKQGDQKKVFLQNDGRVFIANQGNLIDRRYWVVQIGDNSVLLEDMLMNNRQSIPLAAH